MGFLKNYVLGYTGYITIFFIIFFPYNLAVAIFSIAAIVIVGETIENKVMKSISHPIIIGCIGGIFIYSLYIFETVEIKHQLNSWLIISWPFTLLMLISTLIAGSLFGLAVKKHVQLS